MRDIRQDLKERIDAACYQAAAIEEQLAQAKNQIQLLTALLQEEQSRWESDNPDVPAKVYIPRNSRTAPQTTESLTDIIKDLLDSGEAWFTTQIAAVAQKRGYNFGKSQPGRSVHFTLIAMARRGEVENAGIGRWRKKDTTPKTEQIAS